MLDYWRILEGNFILVLQEESLSAPEGFKGKDRSCS